MIKIKNLYPSDTNKNNTQSELTAELSDPELSDALLNSVNSSFNSKQEGGLTAVVAKAKYHRATKNQAPQRIKCSARGHTRNTFIKILLDSGSDGDLCSMKKELPCIFPTWLGRYQTLGARRMGASSQKEGVKSA